MAAIKGFSTIHNRKNGMVDEERIIKSNDCAICAAVGLNIA